MSQLVRVENLSKSFRKVDAVKNLSFTVESGEILGLLGPNGAGKTTALRSLAGALRIEPKVISICDLDLATHPVEAKQNLAYLPDQPSFFDHLTCWEHVQLVANIYQFTDFQARAHDLFDRLEMSEKKNAYASELSKGMKQRLGMICSLIHSPRVIFLDEPMTGLDPKGIRVVHELLLEQKRQGSAIILSSHLLSLLEKICTKILVMSHGSRRLYGSIEEVKKQVTELSKDATLEDIFFYATDENRAP